MAARNKRTHDAKTRERIRTGQLVTKLEKHVFGEEELSSTQLRAAEILLNKTLPNLTAADVMASIEAEVNQSINVIFYESDQSTE